jgi:hypothetical protein
MTYHGTVQNGVIRIDDGACLPEGAVVRIVLINSAVPEASGVTEPSIGQKLAELGRWAETQPCDLPEDLAVNHDHYLHGAPKRQESESSPTLSSSWP